MVHMVHIVGMLVAVVLGPFQFLRSLRDRRRSLHRLMGRLYIDGALILLNAWNMRRAGTAHLIQEAKR